MDFARILRGLCVGFARNLILFLFEREHEGYKRFADCIFEQKWHLVIFKVMGPHLNLFQS